MSETVIKLKEFIKKNSDLFWWIPENKKTDLSNEAVVEAIMNYGNEEQVRELFDILGEKSISKIFKNSIKKSSRSNFFPEVQNFFNLYFTKYVQGYSE
jgi:hypothetical protein